jgi:hypothetical protein
MVPVSLVSVLSFQRITIEEIRADPWFGKNYVAIRRGEDENVSLDDVQAVFDNIEVCEKLVSPSMLCKLSYLHSESPERSLGFYCPFEVVFPSNIDFILCFFFLRTSMYLRK